MFFGGLYSMQSRTCFIRLRQKIVNLWKSMPGSVLKHSEQMSSRDGRRMGRKEKGWVSRRSVSTFRWRTRYFSNSSRWAEMLRPARQKWSQESVWAWLGIEWKFILGTLECYCVGCGKNTVSYGWGIKSSLVADHALPLAALVFLFCDEV